MSTSDAGAVASTEGLGPSVPDEVMLYVHAYGDSRADEDGLSALRIGETVLALRRWAARLQAAERERLRRAVLAMHDAVLDTMASGRPIAHLDSCADELLRLFWPNVRGNLETTHDKA